MWRAALFGLMVLCGACGLTAEQLAVRPMSVAQARTEAYTLYRLINQERMERGIPPVYWNETLSRYARWYAYQMLAFNYLGHGDPWGQSLEERLHGAGIDYASAGENMAMAPDVAGIHREIMGSERHTAIALRRKYTDVGIGLVTVPPGMTYSPFGKPAPEGYMIAVELFIR